MELTPQIRPKYKKGTCILYVFLSSKSVDIVNGNTISSIGKSDINEKPANNPEIKIYFVSTFFPYSTFRMQ